MNYKMYFLLLFLFIHNNNLGTCVDLFFENPDSGFFLKPEKYPNLNNFNGRGSNSVIGPWAGIGEDGGVMDVERFTVLDPARPALIRATYGPFSTKQTVPARYAIPEYPDDYDLNGTQPVAVATSPFANPTHQMELSAHLVVKEVSRARPAVRVLVHGGGARGHHSPHVCVTVLIKKDPDVLSASCTPAGAGETGGDATCLITISIPSRWWPPHTRVTAKLPKTLVMVSYLVGTASGPQQCESRDGQHDYLEAPRVTVQPETEVGEVSLTLDPNGFEEYSADSLVHVLIPKADLHPGTIIHTPLYLHPPGNIPAIILVIKCRVRNGTRILGVEAANSAWNLTVEFNQRRSSASVTAMLVDSEPDNQTLHSLGLHEVFSWVLEVPSDAKAGETKVTWTLQYLMDAFHQEIFSTGNGKKMSAKLTILKDITQAIVPISKSWSIVNTAVLTGRQVSRALKILSVSHAGNVGDVTLQSSCSCSDKAALKVSTSCTSVYLDGSEVRGSQNATIIATFSHFSGAASFIVWMPEVPLLVHLEDTKLSQIKGWKAPKIRSPHTYEVKSNGGFRDTRDNEGSSCSILFQQTPVQVYGRFVAIDDNSGRKSYLLSRDALLRVTELITHMLRVEDPSIAALENQVIKGRSTGFTEIQVLSPIIGHVIGSKEIRVSNDKVWISRLHATVISGLSLSLQPDIKLTDGYDAITTVTPILTAKYQEGLIDTWVELSDGTTIPIREMDPDNYVLKVRSLDSAVIAVAPSPKESQPRIIAIGHGEGELLQVSLELSETCGKLRPTLATTIVRVKVDLRSNLFPGFGNDEKNAEKDSLAEKPISDAAQPHRHYTMPDILSQPAVQARKHPSNHPKVTSLEVGMYVLLAVFGVAIMVFASSFIVYSWRFKTGGIPLGSHSAVRRNNSLGHDSVTNAHDWVWLGRATLERASGIGSSPSSQALSAGNIPLSDLNGNDDQTPTWREYRRFSRGMDKQIGVSSDMNITSNPVAELEPLLNDKETQLCDSSTFTKSSSSKAQRKVTFNKLSVDLARGENDIPPLPPHRHKGVSTTNLGQKFRDPHSNEIGAPPIPPHGINVISNPFETQKERTLTSQQQLIVQQKEEDPSEEESPPRFVEVNADDFVRLRGVTRSRAAQVRRATILENPLLSSVLPDNLNITDHLDNLPPSMDYDQLLEYFSNLKESNA